MGSSKQARLTPTYGLSSAGCSLQQHITLQRVIPGPAGLCVRQQGSGSAMLKLAELVSQPPYA